MKSPWRALAVLLFGLCAAQWLHAAPFAYVAGNDGVTVIDVPSRAVVATIATPGRPLAIAAAPGMRYAYAIGAARDWVIDTAALQTVAEIDGYSLSGTEPAIVADPVRGRFIAGETFDDVFMLAKIKLRTFAGASIQATATDFGAWPGFHMGMDRTGRRLLINTAVHDAATFASIGSIPLSTFASTVDPTRDLVHVLAFDVTRTDISPPPLLFATVNLATVQVTASTPVPASAQDLVATPTGTAIYYTDRAANTVNVVSLTTRAQLASIAVPATPLAIDITEDGATVVVIHPDRVTFIDAQANRVIGSVSVAGAAQRKGRFLAGGSPPRPPDVLTGLWFNPAEPGWGVHVAHRGTKIFAAWFTYEAKGLPKWYVSSDCTLNSPSPSSDFTTEVTCTGNIYDTTGPRFFSDPYNAGVVAVNKLGLFQMGFTDRNNGAFTVVTSNAVKTMTLKRQLFASGNIPGTDYTDLWWNPGESGWGLGITQQASIMFLAWFVYDDTGTQTWYVASNCAVNTAGNGCTGDLYRTTGPADPLRNAFDPSRVTVTKVGSMTASFSDANNGRIDYIVDGRAGSKAITRQLF